jgi:hypothetical protein
MGRLFFLNILLLAGIAAAALKLMELRDETARREALVRDSAPKLPTAKPVNPVPPPGRTIAADYLDVAARLLFAKDRNPAVIITPPAPPPVKPMPALPVAYGVLMMADPPVIMMSAKKADGQKGYRAGDQVGEFKIVSFDARSIVLEWDGQTLTKDLRDLADRDAQTAALMARQEQAAAAQASPAGAPPKSAEVLGGAGSSSPKLGIDMGGGMRACTEDSPAGTVVDGYKKVISESPFGKVCRWEKVK